MKTFTFTHNGFHGVCRITVCSKNYTEYSHGVSVMVSPSVAKRITNLVCGTRKCQCGEGVGAEGEIFIPNSGVVRGNYPQNYFEIEWGNYVIRDFGVAEYRKLCAAGMNEF